MFPAVSVAVMRILYFPSSLSLISKVSCQLAGFSVVRSTFSSLPAAKVKKCKNKKNPAKMSFVLIKHAPFL